MVPKPERFYGTFRAGNHRPLMPSCLSVPPNTQFTVFSEKDPAKLPWKKLDIDIVFECTGIFAKKEGNVNLNSVPGTTGLPEPRLYNNR